MPRKRGRIEIIPLIDIMFFLLAAFMMVSIHKVKVKSLNVSLPTDVPVSQLNPKEDFITLAIDAQGHVAIDKEMVADTSALLEKMKAVYAKNKDQKIMVAADRDARNGDVIAVLGKLRIAGFQHVAFSLKSGGAKPAGAAGAPPAPEPPSASVPPDVSAATAAASQAASAASSDANAASAAAASASATANAASASVPTPPTPPTPPTAPAPPIPPTAPTAPTPPTAPDAPPAAPAKP